MTNLLRRSRFVAALSDRTGNPSSCGRFPEPVLHKVRAFFQAASRPAQDERDPMAEALTALENATISLAL
jgi:hypothetical protein